MSVNLYTDNPLARKNQEWGKETNDKMGILNKAIQDGRGQQERIGEECTALKERIATLQTKLRDSDPESLG